MQQAAAERGYLVLLADAEALHRDQEMYARLALEGRVDGMLAAFGTTNDPLVRAIVGQGVPVVAVNRQVRGVRAAVVADDYAGARLAVEHLVQAGQRRIAHIAGPSDIDTARRRRRGFLDALAHHGLPQPRGCVVDGDYTETGSRAAAAQLVASQRRTGHIEPPTAVFAASLVSALGAVAGFRDAGLTAPTDMSVITMDEHPVATHLNPPLTTVAMPLVEMGAAAARLLVDMVDGTPARQVSISTPPRLVIRESVVPPPTVSGRQGQPARAERVR